MKKHVIFVMTLSLVVMAAPIFAQESKMPEQHPKLQKQNPKLQKTHIMWEKKHKNMANSTSLVGTSIYNSAGDQVGEIQNLVVNLQSGQISYAVVSFDDVTGIGKDLYTVPWQSVSISKNGDSYRANVDKSASGKISRINENGEIETGEGTLREKMDNIWGPDSPQQPKLPEEERK